MNGATWPPFDGVRRRQQSELVVRAISCGKAVLLLTVTFMFGPGPACGDDRFEAERLEQAKRGIAAIEKRVGGRIGVAALESSSGRQLEYRANERFGMCSTFKFLAAAAVLQRADAKEEQLDRFVRYGERDILAYAPITKQHLHDGGMSLEALCAAAIEYSDNTAGNLLLQSIGGPAGLTKYARSLGDETTRLDRMEPELNNVNRGDRRDTTSPKAMVKNMQLLLLGDRLSAQAREKLESWLAQNTTGAGMIRASVPQTWRVGDKTGRSEDGITNDIAIIRAPRAQPILLCVYFAESNASAEERSKVVAETTKVVLEAFSRAEGREQKTERNSDW